MTEIQDKLQTIQTHVFELQRRYSDDRIEFHALRATWECVRFAWYVCAGDLDNARDKWERVVAALDDCAVYLTPHQETIFQEGNQ